jgi:outer membrane protein
MAPKVLKSLAFLRCTLAVGLALTSLTGHARSERMPLNKALYQTIENNLTLKLQGFSEAIDSQRLEETKAIFDPRLTASLGSSEYKYAEDASYANSTSASAGLSKFFSLGTTVSLTGQYRKDHLALNPRDLDSTTNTAAIVLEVRQPLLRGFGREANLAGIRKAEVQLEISQLEYRDWLYDIVSETEKAYWTLAYNNARLRLSRSRIELAQSLLDETLEREEVGLATRIDVLQAKANLATQKESLIQVQRDLDNSKDLLLDQLGWLSPQDALMDLMVDDLRELSPRQTALPSAWGAALKNDLDIKIQQKSLESLGYDLTLAEDDAKTDLDLVLSGSSNGLSDIEANQAISGAVDKDEEGWSVGLEVSVPIGNRASKAVITRTELLISREKTRLKLIENELFKDVRSAWRSVKVSLEQLKAARTTLELQKEAFEQAQAKFGNGLAVFRDVQEAQDDLNRAYIAELNAWVNALIAQAELSRLDGSILDRHNIQLNFEN